MSAKCINKIPAGLPPLPDLPVGWDAWKRVACPKIPKPVRFPMAFNHAEYKPDIWLMSDQGEYGGNLPYRLICLRAVKLPAKKPMAKAAKWRILKASEVLREGDEYTALNSDSIDLPESGENGSGGWIKTSLIGARAGVGKFRRKVANSTTRRESRKSRIGTVVQRAISGQFANAMEATEEIERIYDNSQRAKRRKAGK